jgi:ketosteroid isomerase-like protein
MMTVMLGQASSPSGKGADAGFGEFLTRFEAGLSRFVNGDPTSWKQNISRDDSASIMGAFGGYEAGGQVEPRYDWAATQFRESGATVNVEYLAKVVTADLAYTVAIERSQVRIGDQQTPLPMTLRVTHIFRKEDGAWRLVHRHADDLVAKVRH